jgi:hypothetical protein
MTILLDRATFPRQKLCGDFVGPTALAELAGLGVAKAQAFRAIDKIGGVALHVDGDKLTARPLPQVDGPPPYGRVIPGGSSTPGYSTQPGARERQSLTDGR